MAGRFSDASLGWRDAVSAASAKKGLNPNILLAQLNQESYGNPNAVGSSGEIGLTQFMPETAIQYGVRKDDPYSQINGQAAYMGDLLRQFGGDYDKALAAYNWGPGNMRSVLSRHGENWRSRIPASVNSYIDGIKDMSTKIPERAPLPQTEKSAAEKFIEAAYNAMKDPTAFIEEAYSKIRGK